MFTSSANVLFSVKKLFLLRTYGPMDITGLSSGLEFHNFRRAEMNRYIHSNPLEKQHPKNILIKISLQREIITFSRAKK